jgi:serine/threonine protein kinase
VGEQTAPYRPPLSERDTLTEAPPRATVHEAPPERRPGMPPAPLGYELIRELDTGGMGVVYLAREHATERTVAMKFLRGAASGSAVERFLIELRALAVLDHPNIVRVLGHDFYRADPFFTMEYQPGGDLGDWVKKRGPMPPAEAVRLIRAVAEAVRAAHAKGILHRDLKPSNILLDADGVPKVSDFGLAKRTDADNGITVSSGVIGTPSYMPPEQVSRKWGEVSVASDVYGLGATLYHLVTGRVPFRGENNDQTMSQVERDPPRRPRAIRPEIPRALEAVVMKCLEKQPADRYPSVEALVADLDNCLADEKAIHAPLLTPARRIRLWMARNRATLAVVAATMLVLVGAFVLGTAYRRPATTRDPQDVFRDEIKAGRTAHLIPERGVPEWLSGNWLIHPATLGENVTAGGACSFEALHPSLLAFLKDPGVDSYRVTAQLRIMRSELGAAPKQAPGLREFARSGVGLFVGHVTGHGNDGSEAHGFLLVEFADYIPPEFRNAGITEAAVQPGGMLIAARPDTPLAQPQWGWYPVTWFAPADTLPGEWRVIQIEVRPTGIKFFWGERPGKPLKLLADVPAESIAGNYAQLQKWLDDNRPDSGISLSKWNPRTPFGVWSKSSAVAVRNVTVEILP